ncbi:centrosomal protein of 89 kDa isoform X2 [Macrotis lagotis]|uniref:centrosomal protein of 89 kDa isoform X2 n=1 Tax=Macrotis lagotis TaxID=92651 RepID=UPI003D690BB5
MPLGLRRSRRSQFKHIVHGLVPAATIAPRPAVPRTPPPRSPDPSPERPRSALAAAILMSTLTGRTFALPQPNYQSHSESDITEDGGIIEPYATITEFRSRPEWPDQQGKSCSLQSFKMSDSSQDEDEDVETYLSNDDSQHVKLSTQKKENNIGDAVYAVSHRNNKDTDPLVFRAYPKKDGATSEQRGFPDLEAGSLQMKGKHLQNLKDEKLSAGNVILEKPPPFPVDVAEFLSLRQQAQELVDENIDLKMIVYRLNAELSRYQTKFRDLSKEENRKIEGLPFTGPPPPWLLDRKYLSPLLLAYEDKMKEKDDLNILLEEEMKMFKLRVEEVIKENETLHQELNENSSLTSKEWHQLQTQARLVLEENKILMQQLEIQQAKAKKSNQQHIQKVSKLIKQQVLLENKVKSQEKTLAENKEQLDILRSKCENLKIQLDSQIEIKAHDTVVNELKSHLQKEKEKYNAESDNLIEKMAELHAQNKSLLLDKSKLEAENKVLGAELEKAEKLNRKSQKQINLLHQQVEEAIEKEEEAHYYLTNFVILANSLSQEHNNFMQLAQCLENEKQGFLFKIIKENIRIGKLEERLKMYKKKIAMKMGDANHRMTKQEEHFAEKIDQYQREMKHLQHLLQNKQEALEEVLQQKREVEDELEVVWESTAKENQRMKEFLYTNLEKTHTWKKASIFESGINQLSKEDLVEGYTISYCEVKSSSGIQMPEIPTLHAL